MKGSLTFPSDHNAIAGAFNARSFLVRVRFDKQTVVVAVTSDYAKTNDEAQEVAARRAVLAFQQGPIRFTQEFGCLNETEVFPDTPESRAALHVDGRDYCAPEVTYSDKWHDIETGAIRVGRVLSNLPIAS